MHVEMVTLSFKNTSKITSWLKQIPKLEQCDIHWIIVLNTSF